VLFALLSSIAVLAATAHEVLEGVRERVFPGLVALLVTGLTGVFLTGDLFNFYVFFELAMTAAYVLATYGGARASSAPRSSSPPSTYSERSCSCCRSPGCTT
jgi:multicomponent Na+:H+ antiporter subunit D